jgi:hypothetical protein
MPGPQPLVGTDGGEPAWTLPVSSHEIRRLTEPTAPQCGNFPTTHADRSALETS